MKPAFTTDQINSILNAKVKTIDSIDKEYLISKKIFTEALDQADDFVATDIDDNTAVNNMIANIARTEESISKSILYSALQYTVYGSKNCGAKSYRAYEYTNLDDKKTPNIDGLIKVLQDVNDKAFKGVKVTRNGIIIETEQQATEFYTLLTDYTKAVEGVKYDTHNNEDSDNFAVYCYNLFRGGEEAKRKTWNCYELAPQNKIADNAASIVKAYEDQVIHAIELIREILSKLSLPVITAKAQEKNQLIYAMDFLKKMVICYSKCYLFKSNLMYAAKADAICEFLGLANVYAVDDSLHTDTKSSEDKDSVFDMTFAEAFDSITDEDNLEPVEASCNEMAMDYLYKNSLLEEAQEVYIEDIKQMAQNAVNNAKQAANDVNTKDISGKFKRMWSMFMQFIQQISDKFKGSMDKRIKDANQFLNDNAQVIEKNKGDMTSEVTWSDYPKGIANIRNIKMPDYKQIIQAASKGAVTSIEDIQSKVFPQYKAGDMSFVDYAKIQFLGGTEKRTTAINALNINEMITFCKDAGGYRDITESLTRDLGVIERETNTILDGLEKQKAAEDNAQEQKPTGEASYEEIRDYIKSYLEDENNGGTQNTNPHPAQQQQNQQQANKDNPAKDAGKMDIKDKSGNEVNVPKEKSAEDSNAQAVTNTAQNYQNVLKAVHTAKMTAYENIFSNYMHVLRLIAKGNQPEQQQNQ